MTFQSCMLKMVFSHMYLSTPEIGGRRSQNTNSRFITENRNMIMICKRYEKQFDFLNNF